MLVTEKVASTKSCPQSFHQGELSQDCEGSDCMAWRWHWNIVKTMGLGSPVQHYTKTITDLGYCGLSGSVTIDPTSI